MNAVGIEGMKYLYLGEYHVICSGSPQVLRSEWLLGYYEHKCQKMRYKGEYSPSFLADPVSTLASCSQGLLFEDMTG